MNRVILHGDMAEKFGAKHSLAIRTPHEAIKALSVNKPGFKEYVLEGEFRVIRAPKGTEIGVALDEDTLTLGMSETDLHIFPVPAGSKNAGVGKVLLGVALVGAAIITGGGAAALAGSVEAWAAGTGGFTFGMGLAFLGGAMALGGLAMMMAPSPEAPNPNEQEEKDSSFLFNGVTNVQAQGHPVPLVYGTFMCGSVVASSGFSVEQIGTQRGGSAVDNTGFQGVGGGIYAEDTRFLP